MECKFLPYCEMPTVGRVQCPLPRPESDAANAPRPTTRMPTLGPRVRMFDMQKGQYISFLIRRCPCTEVQSKLQTQYPGFVVALAMIYKNTTYKAKILDFYMARRTLVWIH